MPGMIIVHTGASQIHIPRKPIPSLQSLTLVIFRTNDLEEQSDSMYCDDGYDEELSYLAAQVQITGNGSPAQAMPYCY